ncbi:peptidylprolyl isomerase [Streptomyces sp. P38-E01]|uniref:Peptidylprolyl isomerase n=1 Tax=Streptomyces tardus TaxID=2780544 RepID=A0A949JI98_9ACTN|nr:peptidylprolyl isomerase [Streptomyces tardus]MBU7599967.1 peptidylprolyl isomerase [Streptomyces tardus]
MVSGEQRRKQLAREKRQRRLEKERTAQRRRKVRNASVAAVLAMVLAGSVVWAGVSAFTGTSDPADPAATGDGGEEREAKDPCEKPAGGEPNGKQWDKEPKATVDEDASYRMKLATTCGDIELTLDAEKAPRTVNSFNFLAGEGYFDHTRCHRLVDQGIHVLQCGDPTGTGQGGPGYTIPDENLDAPEVQDDVYPAGTVAMANTYNAQQDEGRDTGGSQFFLVYEDSPLPPDYTPFGTIGKGGKGMDVLRKIAEAGSYDNEEISATSPNATVVINKATVSAD